MSIGSLQPFHLAVQVHDLAEARVFYGEKLGFAEGRSSDSWVDFDFFGHQFVIHYAPGMEVGLHRNHVDGYGVPVPHFGVVLEWEQWHSFRDRLVESGIKFEIEPYIRFKGKPGEQATLFFLDPSGNALEFKAFKDERSLFATG